MLFIIIQSTIIIVIVFIMMILTAKTYNKNDHNYLNNWDNSNNFNNMNNNMNKRYKSINKKPVINSYLILFLFISCSLNLSNFISCHNLICQRIPNLTAQQLNICQKSPEILSVIRRGIQIALIECQQLFHIRSRLNPNIWNCSSWIQNSLNRLYVNITDVNVQGTKEASFAHALFAAAVVYTLSEACTRSNFTYCTCGPSSPSSSSSSQVATSSHHSSSTSSLFKSNNYDQTNNEINKNNDDIHQKRQRRKDLPLKFMNSPPTNSNNREQPEKSWWSSSTTALNEEWKWNGCTQNIQFGVETARLFLDSSEHQTMSPYSLINLHNNNVGRKVIKDGLIVRCQCHGFSGSCTFKTCWQTINGFRQATHLLYNRYKNAKMVSFQWLNKTFRNKFFKKRKSKTNNNHHYHHIGSNNNNNNINDDEKNGQKQQARFRFLQNQWDFIQKSFKNITLFQLNQPNPNRINANFNNIMSGGIEIYGKASKRDLIYLKPSINHCQLLKTKTIQYNNDNYINNNNISSNDSPLYCIVDDNNNVNGTTTSESESTSSMNMLNEWPPLEKCDKLCCGNGRYYKKTYIKKQKCNCKFQFCCSIICQTCNNVITEYQCKND